MDPAWLDGLAFAPNYLSSSASDYSSTFSRRPSECFSELSFPGSRRGSAANFNPDVGNGAQWQSSGSEQSSSIRNLYKKFVGEEKLTRGLLSHAEAPVPSLNMIRWTCPKEERAKARQQAGVDP